MVIEDLLSVFFFPRKLGAGKIKYRDFHSLTPFLRLVILIICHFPRTVDPKLAECESKDSIGGILDLQRIELGITEKGIKFAQLCTIKLVQLRPAIKE